MQDSKSTRAEKSAAREKQYAAKRRALRSQVDFDIPAVPTRYWRAKVDRYFLYLFGSNSEPGITSGPRIRVRRKDPAQLAKLQSELGQGALPGIKYAYVLTIRDPETQRLVRPQVIDRSASPTIFRVGPVGSMSLPFDRSALAANPRRETERVADLLMRYLPAGKTVYALYVNNGPWRWASSDVRATIVQRIRAILAVYGPNTNYARRSPSRMAYRWLDGLTIEWAGTQGDLRDLQHARTAQREAKRVIRKLPTAWYGVLDALADVGAGNVERIALAYAGALDDSETRRVLRELRGKGYVTGDDARWTMTAAGRALLSDIRAVMKGLHGQTVRRH